MFMNFISPFSSVFNIHKCADNKMYIDLSYNYFYLFLN